MCLCKSLLATEVSTRESHGGEGRKVLAAVGGFLLLQRSLGFAATDESIFLTVFACVTGFLSMVNIADALRTWGDWNGYVLFVLPGLRRGLATGAATNLESKSSSCPLGRLDRPCPPA